MAQNDATITLRLDTKPAQRELKSLTKEGKATAGRVGDKMKGISDIGIGKSFTVGAALGVGVGIGKSVVSGGISNVFTESVSGITAGVDAFLQGPQNRAKAGARGDSREAFQELVGRNLVAPNSPEVRGFFEQARNLREKTEVGANRIDQALGGGVKEVGEMMGLIMDKIVGAIKEGFTSILDAVLKGVGIK